MNASTRYPPGIRKADNAAVVGPCHTSLMYIKNPKRKFTYNSEPKVYLYISYMQNLSFFQISQKKIPVTENIITLKMA